jgi:hypothetical protein
MNRLQESLSAATHTAAYLSDDLNKKDRRLSKNAQIIRNLNDQITALNRPLA